VTCPVSWFSRGELAQGTREQGAVAAGTRALLAGL
jgi:hypothetical protein